MKTNIIIMAIMVATLASQAREYHVASNGLDTNDGASNTPFLTIQQAADVAQPGDTITVHEGVYRERINPPRGGDSDAMRIVYQAAKGEEVFIRGSEVIKGWEKVQGDTWKVVIPKTYFGDFNPYEDLIHGDWFHPKGRPHHTGAVYLNGHWLTEAANFSDVLAPAGETPYWFCEKAYFGGTLLNVAWLNINDTEFRASDFSSQEGIKTAECSEGGKCIGYIESGDWVQYGEVDFGQGVDTIELRVASDTDGGIIEFRLGEATGELLGTAAVSYTSGWQRWKTISGSIRPMSGQQALCLVFKPHEQPERDEKNTTIWAQFKGVDPNAEHVEINVRQTVFYPEEPGMNYITVRGFTMEHAATNWAPPTAEQKGLIGTHWSKGWIIADNTIRYSVCTGVTLGKHGDEFDNTSADTAEGYVKTIDRALARGWSKENIGHHVVRNNHISHCEQAGIVGSMGPVFCQVTDNTIHDIHVRRLFSGAEMAGIKFHGAVDTVISRNHIYRSTRGIWLDWMTQGTRVTRNLLHDNGPGEDLFVEVNHGPFLVENNILLSGKGILVNSQGAAYVHNLVAGRVRVLTGERRHTPYLKEHSTAVAGLAPNPSGDERYYNNLFVNLGTDEYDPAVLPMFMTGNVYLNGAKPSKHESSPLTLSGIDPGLELVEKADGMYLQITFDKAWAGKERQLITTELLGKAKTPDLPYVQHDGTPYRIDTDYFGKKRSKTNPAAGPFENAGKGKLRLRVWPRNH